jgi:hypothetical protein
MKIFKIGGAIFTLIGIGFLIGAYFELNSTIYFEQNAIETMGEVLRIETRSSYDSESRSTIYSDYAFIKFQNEYGMETEIEKLVSPDFEIEVGEKVVVRYLPENPSEAKLSVSFMDQYGLLIIFMVFGLAFGIGGGFAFWTGIKDDVNERRSKKFTQTIEAEVIDIAREVYNEKSPTWYRIIAKGIHPRTNEQMIFRSKIVPKNPESIKGELVTVKLHDTDNSLYWVVVDDFD